MQYLLMIYGNEADRSRASNGDLSAVSNDYATFTRDIIESGNFKGGERLEPSTSATSVRIRDGKTLMTDGPFAETREQLAGYYIIEAKHLDEATSIAARMPGARTGTIEVRPIIAFRTEQLQHLGRAS